MGTTIYRVTGIMLSLTVALLGTGAAVLLYYAGQDAIDLFYKDSTYMDEYRRIHKRMPTDDWYGELILKGWAFGFIYVVPGLTGITASLFFEKITFQMVIHLIIAILALFVGSFLHTTGAMAIILFRVFTVNGVIRYDSWPGDCIYVRYEDGLQQEVEDEKCEIGRKALTKAIAAASVVLVAWVFLLSEIVFSGFTFHNIGKDQKKSRQAARHEDRPRPHASPKRRRAPATPRIRTIEEQASTSHNTVSEQYTPPIQTTPSLSTFQTRRKTEEQASTSHNTVSDDVAGQHTPPKQTTPSLGTFQTRRKTEEQASTSHNTVSDDVAGQHTPQTQTTPSLGTLQTRRKTDETASSQQYDNQAYATDTMDASGADGNNTDVTSDTAVSAEMVNVEEKEMTAF